MKIDHGYLKGLLEAFEDSPEPTTDIEALARAGFSYDADTSNFIFHMALLNDMGLIEREDGDAGFGLYAGIGGFNSWSVMPLRLTANGHGFLEALRNNEVWSTIQRDFKNVGIRTMYQVATSLFAAYLTNKITNL